MERKNPLRKLLAWAKANPATLEDLQAQAQGAMLRCMDYSEYEALKKRVQELQKSGKMAHELTDQERADWAWGNAVIDCPEVTLEHAEEAVKRRPKSPKQAG